MKLLHTVLVAAAALMVTVLMSQFAYAASPNGNWYRPKTGATIKVFNCGGGLGMRVIKSKTPSKVGKLIMCGAKKTSSNKWKGSIKNLDDGKTYTGYVTLNSARRLTLQGCALGGLICKSDSWTKR